MIYYRNLVTGQWQFGNIVAGRGTNIRIDSIDVKPYDINAQDYQVPRADEARFGNDQFKPTTIEFVFNVLHNRLLPSFRGMIPNFWHSMPTVADLAREWRFDEGRNVWGQMKPLYMRSKFDGVHKVIFGRPGQFSVTQDDMYAGGESVTVTAEFRRGDTFAYSLAQRSVTVSPGGTQVRINGTSGQGPSWLKILLRGPINKPVLTFRNLLNQASNTVIELDYNVPAGRTVEINGEPWSRRVITDHNPPLNLAANLAGSTPYLDRLRFNFDSAVTVQLTGSGTTSSTRATVSWRDSYQVI